MISSSPPFTRGDTGGSPGFRHAIRSHADSVTHPHHLAPLLHARPVETQASNQCRPLPLYGPSIASWFIAVERNAVRLILCFRTCSQHFYVEGVFADRDRPGLERSTKSAPLRRRSCPHAPSMSRPWLARIWALTPRSRSIERNISTVCSVGL